MILCHYTNTTCHIQIARVANIDSWFLERVVIPGGSIIFEAPAAAQLEIYCSKVVTSTLSDKIWCEQLKVREEFEHMQCPCTDSEENKPFDLKPLRSIDVRNQKSPVCLGQ
jgi:Domain of unknown function (DUF1830)